MFLKNLLKKFQFIAAKNSFNYLKKYISSKDTILDVGSGKGDVPKFISKWITPKVKCIDIFEFKDSTIHVEEFDGIHIPYPNSNFSVVLAIYVLHHSENPIALLEDLIRVSSDRIIIIEDLKENLWDRIYIFAHRIISYFIYNSNICLMKFRCDKEWKEIFSKLNLEVIAEEVISTKNFTYRVNRKLYVLKKS